MNTLSLTKKRLVSVKQTLIFKAMLTCLFSALFLTTVFSQNQIARSGLDIRAGITVGTPYLKLPEGGKGHPGVGLNVGLEYTYQFRPRFSFTIGAAYAQKRSNFTSPIAGEYDAARGVFGEAFPFPLRINYTADVAANYEMSYLDFPILLNVHLKRWWIGIGYQYSTRLKGDLDGEIDIKALLINFNDRAFDHSDNIKEDDHAIILKVGRQLTRRISVATDFTVSARELMYVDEEGLGNPHNVFLNVLVGFKFF